MDGSKGSEANDSQNGVSSAAPTGRFSLNLYVYVFSYAPFQNIYKYPPRHTHKIHALL